jgi:hypothetical protein
VCTTEGKVHRERDIHEEIGAQQEEIWTRRQYVERGELLSRTRSTEYIAVDAEIGLRHRERRYIVICTVDAEIDPSIHWYSPIQTTRTTFCFSYLALRASASVCSFALSASPNFCTQGQGRGAVTPPVQTPHIPPDCTPGERERAHDSASCADQPISHPHEQGWYSRRATSKRKHSWRLSPCFSSIEPLAARIKHRATYSLAR